MEKSVNNPKSGFVQQAENVRSRINSVLTEKGLTENSVAAGDSAAQSRLNSQLSHTGRITLDTVLRILDACPDISADWLLRGIGEKHRATTIITGASKVTGQRATVIGQQVGVTEEFSRGLSEDFVNKLLAEKDKQIETLLKLLAK